MKKKSILVGYFESFLLIKREINVKMSKMTDFSGFGALCSLDPFLWGLRGLEPFFHEYFASLKPKMILPPFFLEWLQSVSSS